MLGASIVAVMLALVCYTLGTWAQLKGGLKTWHVALLGVAVTCDAVGTYLMYQLAAADQTTSLTGAIMAYVGPVALSLMVLQVVLGIAVLRRGRPVELKGFYKLSIALWLIWLIPFLAGAIGAGR